MKNLFGQDGPVMRALTDLSTLMFLNILTVIFCIPVVTAGASLAAMHYIFMEMIEERGGPLVTEFWKRFKENLKNATPIWLIMLAAAVFLYCCSVPLCGLQDHFLRAGRPAESDADPDLCGGVRSCFDLCICHTADSPFCV